MEISGGMVTIATLNFEIMMRFYQQLLDRSPIQYQNNIYAEFDLNGLKLGIFRPNFSNELEFFNSRQGTMSICLEVVNLKAIVNHLQELNYSINPQIIKASHGQETYLYDPDGNRLILHEGI